MGWARGYIFDFMVWGVGYSNFSVGGWMLGTNFFLLGIGIKFLDLMIFSFYFFRGFVDRINFGGGEWMFLV